MRRRQFCTAVVVGGAVSLAGCLGDGNGDDDDNGDELGFEELEVADDHEVIVEESGVNGDTYFARLEPGQTLKARVEIVEGEGEFRMRWSTPGGDETRSTHQGGHEASFTAEEAGRGSIGFGQAQEGAGLLFDVVIVVE